MMPAAHLSGYISPCPHSKRLWYQLLLEIFFFKPNRDVNVLSLPGVDIYIFMPLYSCTCDVGM